MAKNYQKKIDTLEKIMQELSGDVVSERVQGMRELVRELDGCTEANTNFCELEFDNLVRRLSEVSERGADMLTGENRLLA